MKTNVKLEELTADQKAALVAELKAEEEKKKQRVKDERLTYSALVDETIDASMEDLLSVSGKIGQVKIDVLNRFKRAIDVKSELFDVKDDQRSYTFTNSEGTKRIILGVHTLDNYKDTVNEGIAIVRECIINLGTDDNSRALVSAVMKLMSKDQKGNLKPSRVLQLRRIAEETKNQRLIDGVKIIEDAYQPIDSKRYIRAEVKEIGGEWRNVPLGMTESK